MNMDKRKTKAMTLDELEGLIARHGARTASWPPDQRAAAEALMAGSPAARTLVARQRALDLLFDTAPPEVAPEGLQARILAAVARQDTAAPTASTARRARRGGLFGGLSGLWPQAVGFAAASLLGFMIGSTNPTLLPLDEGTDLSAYIVGYEDESFMAGLIEDIQP